MSPITAAAATAVVSSRPTGRSGLLVTWLCLGALLLSFPLALICPPGTDWWGFAKGYNGQWLGCISQPAFLPWHLQLHWLPLITAAGIACAGIRPRLWNRAALLRLAPFVLFILLGLIGYIRHRPGTNAALETLAPALLIPCLALLLAEGDSRRLERLISRGIASFWLVNAIIIILCRVPEGLLGNRNWAAITFIAATPWCIAPARSILYRLLNPLQAASANAASHILGWILPWAAALAVALMSGSLAAILALPLLLLALLWRGLPRRWGWIIPLGLIAAAAAFLLIPSAWRSAVIVGDVRPFLWIGSLRMIEAAPWLGHGPGSFMANYPVFRPGDQLLLPVAATGSSHPHSQLLLYGVELGLAGLLCALAAILSLARLAWKHSPHPAAATLVVLGWDSFVDNALVKPQPLILLCLAAAVLLSRSEALRRLQSLPQTPVIRWCLLLSGSFIIACALVPALAWTNAERFYREARLWEAQANTTVRLSTDARTDSNTRRQQLQFALAKLDLATKADPAKLPSHHLACEIALYRLHNPAAAQPHMVALLTQAPFYANTQALASTYYTLIAAAKQGQEREKALASADRHYQTALQLSSHSPSMQWDAVREFVSRGQLTLAATAARNFLELTTRSRDLVAHGDCARLGQALNAAGQDKARELQRELLAPLSSLRSSLDPAARLAGASGVDGEASATLADLQALLRAAGPEPKESGDLKAARASRLSSVARLLGTPAGNAFARPQDLLRGQPGSAASHAYALGLAAALLGEEALILSSGEGRFTSYQLILGESGKGFNSWIIGGSARPATLGKEQFQALLAAPGIRTFVAIPPCTYAAGAIFTLHTAAHSQRAYENLACPPSLRLALVQLTYFADAAAKLPPSARPQPYPQQPFPL